MRLFLVRHGDAVMADIDQQRPLSTVGLQQVNLLAQHLKAQGVHPKHIYHSGILRAEQTAKILAEQLHVLNLQKMTGLLPEDSTDIVFHAIPIWTEDTMLVGHLPYMDNLVWTLTDKPCSVMFNTATAVCLKQVNTGWVVDFVVS